MDSTLQTKPVFTSSKVEPKRLVLRQHRFTIRTGLALTAIILAVGFLCARIVFVQRPSRNIVATPPLVVVSPPLQRDVDGSLEFLGQFSAVDHLELRAQVGGTLTKIGFKDGDIVHPGDLLFVIDPTPYRIRLSEATAQLESARARLDLAKRELVRADSLKKSGADTIENFDQKAAEQQSAQAAVDAGEALSNDARFDLDHCQITAPFVGRIGSHLVSVGNLISGSRAGTSPTTLLATLVSLDPIYLNFDMSEADYMTFLRERQKQNGSLAEKVLVSLSDETRFTHQGVLDFVDNSLDRSSGTIQARATLPNSDLLLTPGGFARVRLEVAVPTPALLVPDASLLPDQSGHIILTVGPNNLVVPKQVQVGDLRGGLRVIRSGLTPSDQVIIDGIQIARPGSKVTPRNGSIRFGSDQNTG
jgi:RND family efflux transporter MFP subunit